MGRELYEKFPVFYDGTHATLFNCSPEVPHLAIGMWKGFFQLQDHVFINEMWKSLDFIKHGFPLLIDE